LTQALKLFVSGAKKKVPTAKVFGSSADTLFFLRVTLQVEQGFESVRLGTDFTILLGYALWYSINIACY